jgi:hypothetical protein
VSGRICYGQRSDIHSFDVHLSCKTAPNEKGIKKMTAFHANWTGPFFARNPGMPYFIEDYDLLTTILSALEWRKHNGDIQMITDTAGAAYYHDLGLAHIWNLGVTDLLENSISHDIATLPFWAAGKIFALQSRDVPCAMIDTDFIVWKPLASELAGVPLAVIHREEISDAIYPGKPAFIMDEQYRFPVEWDWSVLPCNTAFLYISDGAFKTYYTSESIRFMKNLRASKNITAEMVFAEQRLLGMCAAAQGIAVKSLLDSRSLESQDGFTHVWGMKEQLRANQEERRRFCVNCVKRIIWDFPEQAEVLESIGCVQTYLTEKPSATG